LNTFDIIVLAVFSIFIARGVWIGFIRQLTVLIAFYAGFWAAGHFGNRLTPLIIPYIENQQIAFLLTCFFLFVIVYILVIFTGKFFKTVMEISLLTWFDRSVGGFFGFLKALFITNIIFLIIIGTRADARLKGSYMSEYFLKTSNYLLFLVKDQKIRTGFLKNDLISPSPGFMSEEKK
jgi:membrane protein required for colicin V production